jgi:hypothetical protein
MIMRNLFLLTLAVGFASPALAYESFIPLGAGYSTSVSAVPVFGSAEARKAARSDSYETDIYLKGRKKIEDESRLRQFLSNRNSSGVGGHIDY